MFLCFFFDKEGLIVFITTKSVIQLLVEGGVAPLNASGEMVEVDEVLHDALVVTHAEILEVGLCFTLGVMQFEVVLQLCNKVRVV